MSNEQKPRGTASGKAESPLSQLKELWKRLPESSQDYWREQFASHRTQADLRKEILAKFKINLSADGRLTTFRDWLKDQDKRDQEALRQQEDERRIEEKYPGWNKEQIREEVIRLSYARSISDGDFSEARKTIVQDLNIEKVELDKRKVALLEKKAAQLDQIKEIRERKPGADMTDADRAAIVDKVDEILGLK